MTHGPRSLAGAAVVLAVTVLGAVGLPASASAKRMIIDLSHAERVTYRTVGSENLDTSSNEQRQDVDRWADGLGFEVETAATSPFSLQRLDGVSVVALLQPDGTAGGPATLSAGELEATRRWLEAGGVLVLVADPLITTSGGDFTRENVKAIRPYASSDVVNATLAGLGLDARVTDTVMWSTDAGDRPQGAPNDGISELYGSNLPQSAVRLESVGVPQGVGHWVGAAVTGADATLARATATTYATTRADAAAHERGGPEPPPAPGFERGTRPVGVGLVNVGLGKVVVGGDLSLHAFSYGSGTFYDNDSFGMRPFWNRVLPALAGNAPRTSGQAGAPTGSGGGESSGGTQAGQGTTGGPPASGASAAPSGGGAAPSGARDPEGAGRRPGSGSGSGGAGERSRSGSGREGRGSGSGALSRRPGSGSGGEARSAAAAGSASSGASGAPPPSSTGPARSLSRSSAPAAEGEADSGGAAAAETLPEPSSVPGAVTARELPSAPDLGAGAGDDPPPALAWVTGAIALALLGSGFAGERRRVRRALA